MDSRHILALSPTLGINQINAPQPQAQISLTPTHPLDVRSHFSCSRVFLESRSHRLSLSPWITAPLSLSLLPLLSFSFAFEWRAIELLRADKRETQFKLRLLAVVTTVIITLAFHGDSVHTCMDPTRQYVASSLKFTERTFLRSISPFIIRDGDRWLKTGYGGYNQAH